MNPTVWGSGLLRSAAQHICSLVFKALGLETRSLFSSVELGQE